MSDGQTEVQEQIDLDAREAADRRYARACRTDCPCEKPYGRPPTAAVVCAILVVLYVVILLIAGRPARGAGARAATPCTITVWRMGRPVTRIESRDWPTIQPQVGGGVRITFEGPQGSEEIGGMVVYHVSRRAGP